VLQVWLDPRYQGEINHPAIVLGAFLLMRRLHPLGPHHPNLLRLGKGNGKGLVITTPAEESCGSEGVYVTQLTTSKS